MRWGRCAHLPSVAAGLHLILLCLSCLQSVAFHASCNSIYVTRHLKSSPFCQSLPELQLFDASSDVAGLGILSQYRRLSRPLSMSTNDDDGGADQLSVTESVSPNDTIATPGTSESSSSSSVPSSLTRSLLVAIPLMMKFALVLIIKFLTDLVVFPLLLTYRAARLTKRRIVKIWKQWTSWSGKTTESSTEIDLDVEGYKPNGSAP
jgi:hypothetical protein